VRGVSPWARAGAASGLLIVLWTPAAGAQAAAPRDRWVGADKVKHFALAFFVQSMGYSAARATGAGHRSSLALASVVTAVTGVGKEWHDRRTTGFSARDLAWDAAGAGAATLLLRRTSR
jgi:uncharacterized protein YfiM (DUF2279 family)